LQTNQFNGTIPKQIAQLTALTYLCDAELAYDFRASLTPSRAPCCRALSDNQFTGTIPTQIGQLTALTYLYVAIVRGGVSCFTMLLRRYLSNNQLSGTIPTQIAQLTALSYLYVAIVRWWCFVSIHDASSQVLVQQSPHRTDSSVEFDNCPMVSDAFTLHLFDLISSIPISNLQLSKQRCQLPGEPSSTFK
jgi:hypothetical protein